MIGIQEIIESLPEDLPHRDAVAHSLENDRHLAIAIRVEQLRSQGRGLHREPGGCYDLAGIAFCVSPSTAESAYRKYRASLQESRSESGDISVDQ